MNMGLFYGSSTCYTEMAAEKIRDIIGPELVTLHNLKVQVVELIPDGFPVFLDFTKIPGRDTQNEHIVLLH